MQSKKLRLYVFGLVVLSWLAISPAAQAQTTWYVPDDFPTLQDAVFAAAPGDTIVLAEGEFCGAGIFQPLTITGASNSKSKIVACPGQSPYYTSDSGKPFWAGLLLFPEADGSTISHLTFDGSGWAEDNDRLATGIWAPFFRYSPDPTADDLTIEHNRFLGGIGHVIARGSGITISHNVFDGYTIDDETSIGGWGIDLLSLSTILTFLDGIQYPTTTDNTIAYNKFRTTVRDGVDSPWLPAIPDVTFVGIAADDQNNLLVRGNSFDIAPDSTGTLLGAGLLMSDSFFFGSNSDAVIVKNDGRGSGYSIIITLDQGGGTGNTAGAVIRGNFGVNDINNTTSDVTNRSIATYLECDEFGVCQ